MLFLISMLAALLRALFFTFYRHRAARKQYFHVLSSPCSAETIFVPFYRHRAARKQYLCHFIVTVQRGNNIFAVLSSPCSAGIIFLHFIVCSITASIKIFVFTFAERRCVLENGRGCACVPARTSAQRRFHTKNTCIVHGDERWMRPCRATRAGTQAPPLPTSIKPLCHATFLRFVRRQTVCHQPFRAFVYRQTLRRQPFSMEHHAPEILPT